MNRLDYLEATSITILREARAVVPKPAMLWSFGKDSTALVHLARKAFLGRVPFPLIHCDTGLEMDEVYAFRDQLVQTWKLEMISAPCPPVEATDPSLPDAARVAARKTLGLKAALAEHGFTGIIAGIRRDEEAIRSKERVFSPRTADGQWLTQEQPPELWGRPVAQIPPGGSLRIHPLLEWTERDVWQYIARERIPVAPLYFARPYHAFEGREFGGAMMRFRSLGERGITWPVPSRAATVEEILAELETTRAPERGGRPMGSDEDETAFERLRTDGYM